jgi:hypothetical protein
MTLAACGNRCDFCPRFIATQNGDISDLNIVARLWFEVGWRGSVVDAEEIKCNGCRAENLCRYSISQCAEEKKVGNCGKCSQYPCENISKAFEKTLLYNQECKEKFPKELYSVFQEAFFFKKENLDKTNKE